MTVPHSTSDAVQFLQGWAPEGPWVLTSIVPDGGGITTATFGPATTAQMHQWIDARQGRQNIYFTVNAVFGDVEVKPNKGAISGICAIHVDVDPRPKEDPEAERERAFKLLRAYDPPPTVIIDSGGGAQGFWRLGGDVPTGGSRALSELVRRDSDKKAKPLTPEERALVDAHLARLADLVERRNLAVETALQADACHNADRIMRLPGTINVPGEQKRKKGRTARLASVVEVDWTRLYSLDAFPRAPEVVASAGTPPAGGQAPVVLSANLPRIDDLTSLGLDDKWQAIIVQGADPEEPGRWATRSEAVWAVMCHMVRAKCTDDQIAAVILDPDYKISGHVLDQKPSPERYAARQIARARVEAIDPELAELNARHAVIESLGPKGQCRIMERLPTPDGRGYIAFQSFEDFGHRYDNRMKVVGKGKDGKEIMMPLGKWWKMKEERRQFKMIAFLPGGPDLLPGNVLNLWNGFAVSPAPGSWALMQQHILEVLADGDKASAEYITKWAAYAVQHPDKPAEAALVFRGGLGTGKGAFGRAMMKLFGQHGIRTQGAAVLDSRFNVHLRDCVLLFADEVDWDSRRSDSQLKGMVTEDTLFIEPKGVDATSQPNFLHIIIASNSDWVIPATPGERRYAAFGVSDKRKGDKEYFSALFGEMEAGGLAAMLHDLLAMDLTGFHPRWSIPQTEELSAQKLAGLSGEWRIAREMLMGAVAVGVEQAAKGADRVLLVRPLIRWALENRIVATDPGELRMTNALKKMGMTKAELTIKGLNRKAKCWVIPPLAEARATWAKNLGVEVEWPEDDDWATFPAGPDA